MDQAAMDPYRQDFNVANDASRAVARSPDRMWQSTRPPVGAMSEGVFEQHDTESGEDDKKRVHTNPHSSRGLPDGPVDGTNNLDGCRLGDQDRDQSGRPTASTDAHEPPHYNHSRREHDQGQEELAHTSSAGETCAGVVIWVGT